MHSLFSFFRIIFVAGGMLVLAGCSGWQQYMNNASNKNPDMPKQTAAQTSSIQKCHSWCHNGWCSTHCENNE